MSFRFLDRWNQDASEVNHGIRQLAGDIPWLTVMRHPEFHTWLVTFVVSLIALVTYIYPSSKNPSTVPGLTPITKEDGNLGDIAKAGSLQEFLVDLHKQFGPIASFWFGPTYVVSIADSKLFKQHHNVFDRPPVLFKLFEPLIGPKSIQYANGEDGQARRHLYDKCLTHDAIKKYYQVFQEIADELSKKWETLLNEEHIPLSKYMAAFALKFVLAGLYGTQWEDSMIMKFRACFDVAWNELEQQLKEPPTPERLEAFEKAKKQLYTVCKEMVKMRKKEPTEHAEEYLLDLILDLTDDVEQQHSDALTFVIAGFHTTGNLLTWAFYFLATHPDVQDKVYKEIKDVLGKDEVDHTNIGELKYMRQVQDETLRCAVIAPYAARYQDIETELGGHKIPKNTPVLHALGVTSVDETLWPLPNNFDPDRFKSENLTGRPHLSFVPFGFSGKRACPGQRFSYAETTVAMVTLLRKYKINIVEGQVIERVHGLVTHPSDEIWITISKRK